MIRVPSAEDAYSNRSRASREYIHSAIRLRHFQIHRLIVAAECTAAPFGTNATFAVTYGSSLTATQRGRGTASPSNAPNVLGHSRQVVLLGSSGDHSIRWRVTRLGTWGRATVGRASAFTLANAPAGRSARQDRAGHRR